MDALAQFKQAQKQRWVHFAPLETVTTPAAARLVKHARVRAGQRVLDVACGTGVVGITAARLGAKVSALDLTPELLERAKENAGVAGVDIEWREGDAEQLPFEDASFDVVLSQFGHIFAPRPAVVIGEMLRVLKPGGTIAFSTWPPELYVGRAFALTGRYLPPPPQGVSPPSQWGDPNIVRERLGSAVHDVVFDRDRMLVAGLSVVSCRQNSERHSGPVSSLIQALSASDPARLAEFRREFEALIAEYFEDNVLHQDYLMTRATKA